MRKLLIAACALAVAAPAGAQAQSPADREVLRDLPPAAEIDAMGETIGRVADALMDVRIGPVLDAADPYRSLHRRQHDQTIGDIVSRDDPYARERMRDSIGDATAGIGVMVEELAALTPVMRHAIEQRRRRMEDAIRDGRNTRRFHDPDPYPDYDRDR